MAIAEGSQQLQTTWINHRTVWRLVLSIPLLFKLIAYSELFQHYQSGTTGWKCSRGHPCLRPCWCWCKWSKLYFFQWWGDFCDFSAKSPLLSSKKIEPQPAFGSGGDFLHLCWEWGCGFVVTLNHLKWRFLPMEAVLSPAVRSQTSHKRAQVCNSVESWELVGFFFAN